MATRDNSQAPSASWISQVRKGLVEYVVLLALRQREAYGYEILQTLVETRHFSIGESTLYPLLARLTHEGHLAVRAVDSPSGPRRRYYRLTASGLRLLADMDQYWQELVQSIDALREGTRT